MKRRLFEWKHAAILTLLLFSASFAALGIFKTMPKPSTTSEDLHTVSSPEAVEVFSSGHQAVNASVFSGFIPPVTGKITSGYGYRQDPFSNETTFHKGVDVAVPKGTEVLACGAGTVTSSAYDETGGNYIILSHGDGKTSYYGHLQTRIVAKGDEVSAGDVIGLSGDSGRVTGAHLHFQLTYQERTVDPVRYFDLES